MSFSKNDLEIIKSKISIGSEIEKKTRLVQKGKDYWCCCLFHEEKTPSCKINEDQGSFYCFGCGAKGDIFTLYTDLYNYNFVDAVKELSQRAGVQINFQDKQKTEQENQVEAILKLTCTWYQNNLSLPGAKICNEYLQSRELSKDTIVQFKLGYSYNYDSTLYDFLKKNSFNDNDLLKSNVVKLDKNNKIRDYFYKRLIFPIINIRGNVVGFGGRSLDNSDPKYINSPESSLFKKRYLLYNLDLAKTVARKKNNLLICEGYMDVISLYQNGIKSVVAPLGTALTEDQLILAWKYSSKPTIMFDGDNAGIRASYKSAIMALSLISSKRFLQFVLLPGAYDPDSFLNTFSIDDLILLLKNPVSLINFIFDQSSKALEFKNVDEKITFDKYLDDLVKIISDNKIKYFYKNELKSLFFNKIRNSNKSNKALLGSNKIISTSLNHKQILSFIATLLNHLSVRKKILIELLASDLLDLDHRKFLEELSKSDDIDKNIKYISQKFINSNSNKLIKSCLNTKIYQLFPYSNLTFDPESAYEEVSKSLKNLNTRLLNLKKINKSLNTFVNDSSALNWSELQNINLEVLDED